MSAAVGPDIAAHLEEGTALTLRVLSAAMGAGIALLIAISLFFYSRAPGVFPDPRAVRGINTLTMISMAASIAAIVASEAVWKIILRGAVEVNINARTRTAFIVRSALREGAALMGSVTFFLACQNGVLRAHPAYWVDLVPAGLFWFYLYVHWPRLDNLRTEVAAVRSL